ncbi:hypothetical protein RND81_10G182500 [Saponaria officinalis]|uniref:D-aminoacid aminotransferase-like PLP-dependent enzymes superfamily protein n=1 Tax=Saponaria officinalis TaxID=3572 RepID=A0AAW1I643_SAPOF
MSTSPATFLIKNATVLPAADTPPISTFLATHPGVYTTTRTHNNGETLIFYNRHLKRLSNSLRFLLNSNPRLIFGPQFCSSFSSSLSLDWDSMIRRRITASMRVALPVAISGRSSGEELSISALIGGNAEELSGRIDDEMIDRVFDVYVHIGMYVPPVFGVVGNGARLAVVGNRRDFAEAKYSDWVRLRKPLEKLRPPSATELLLSDDDGRILEGTITNFFVVCSKGNSDIKEEKSDDNDSLRSYELQTAPVKAGVLPGIIRQLVLEICLCKGITFREVAPSWFERENWQEAFITNSLRLVQHVESIQAPSSRASLESKSWEEVSWTEKQFKASPGFITTIIQREIMEKAAQEGCSLAL